MKKTLLSLFLLSSISLHAIADNDTAKEDDFQKKIDAIMSQATKPKMDAQYDYIYNLQTTEFIKGLLVESTFIFRYIADNSDNHDNLIKIKKEALENTVCLQSAMGNEALKHLNNLFPLTLTTQEEKDDFKTGNQWLNKNSGSLDYDEKLEELCKNEGIKAEQFVKSIKEKSN